VGWLVGWQYRKKITISGSSGAGTNYQVLLKVGESSDTTGCDFSVEGHSLNFPSVTNQSGDLRFTSSDGTTPLSFWVEKVEGTSPNRVAHIWVKVADSLDSDVDIYCYYGNSNTGNVSNGNNTFIFFDDFYYLENFDSGKWDKVGSGSINKTYETQFTASHGGQGLANDGTYFYFGSNSGESGTIYKIRMLDGVEEDSFTGPPHPAGGDWRDDHNTLIFSSGGNFTPEVWEINPSTGSKIREWDFSGEGYNRGALVAYKSENRIFLFTSDTSGNFKIKEYEINDDETWIGIGIEYSHSSLGVPQGLDYVNGHLYFLYDNGLSKLQLNDDGSITILETLSDLPGTEREGLTYHNGFFYYGDADLVIRKILYQVSLDISSNHVSIYSKNANYGTDIALRCRWKASSVDLDYPGFGFGNKSTTDIVDDSYGGHGITIGKLHWTDNYLLGRQSDDGTNRAETGSICSTQNQFHTFEIRRKSSSADYVVDDGTPTTLSNYYPTENLYVGIGGHYRSDESGQSIADWILIRKYVFPEPIFSLASAEEVVSILSGTACDKCGNPIVGHAVKVFVLDKETGELLGQTTSNSNGNWNCEVGTAPGTKVVTVLTLEGEYGGDTDIAGAEFNITQEGS